MSAGLKLPTPERNAPRGFGPTSHRSIWLWCAPGWLSRSRRACIPIATGLIGILLLLGLGTRYLCTLLIAVVSASVMMDPRGTDTVYLPVLFAPFLIGLRNRLSTMINWFWAYLRYGSGIRLITGHSEITEGSFRSFLTR